MRFLVLALVVWSMLVSEAIGDGLACSEDTLLGRIYYGDYTDLLIDEEVVYVVSPITGLVVFDAADPLNPIEITSMPAVLGERLVRDGDLLIVGSDSDLPMQLLDIRNPASPVVLSEIDQSPFTYGLVDDMLYVVTLGYMHFYDVSDPASPSFVQGFEIPDWISFGSFEFVGDTVLVNRGGLFAFELEDALVGGFVMTPLFDLPNLSDARYRDGYIYAASSREGLFVYDVRDPDRVVEVYAEDGIGAEHIEIVGSVLYLSEGDHGVRIVDISDPSRPRTMERLRPGFEVKRVRVEDNLVYTIASRYQVGGVSVFDTSRSRTTALRSTVPLDVGGRLVAADGGIACVASRDELSVIDISDPDDAFLIGSYAFDGGPVEITGLEIGAGVAFVASVDGHIRIIGIDDPRNPTLVDSIGTGDQILAMDLDGDYLYLGGLTSGLRILDVSSLGDPSLVGVYLGGASEAMVGALDARGGLVSIAIEGVGIHLLDVSDPTLPRLLSLTGLRRDVIDITLADGEAYYCKIIGSDSFLPDTKLYRFDISDPGSPEVVDQVTFDMTSGLEATSFVVHDRYGYLQNCNLSVMVFDLDDPGEPLRHVSTYRSGGSGWRGGLAIDGDTLLYTNGDLELLDLREDIGCSDCLADFDGDLDFDADDIHSYIEAHSSREVYADLEFDGDWDYFDVWRFIEAVRGGCP